MDELERQNILRGKLMSMLLAKGVRRQDISSEELATADIAGDDFDDLFTDMVVWLRDEGFVCYDSFMSGTNNETCVSYLAPTSRGMTLLDQSVDGATARDHAKSTGKGETDTAWYAKFGAMIGGFVGGYVQSAS